MQVQLLGYALFMSLAWKFISKTLLTSY